MTSSTGTGASAPTSSYLMGGLGIVEIDNPPKNVLSGAVKAGLLRELDALRQNPSVQFIAITGKGSFFSSGSSDEGAENDAAHITTVTAAIEALEKPVVAFINGPAEDDGLSVALACDWRIAFPNGSAGLPSTTRGLIPAGGISQRLPRLLGAAKALEMVAAARLGAADAHRVGLFDDVTDGSNIADHVAKRFGGWQKRPASVLQVPAQSPEELDKASKAAIKRGKGSQAVTEIVRLIGEAGKTSFAEGLDQETRASRNAESSTEAKALRHLAWAEKEAAASSAGDAEPRPVSRVAVVGGGTMGSGIAVSVALSGLPVDIVEQTAEAAAGGRQRVEGVLNSQVKAGRLTADAATSCLERINATERWDVIASADLIIEAAFEDMDVKRSIFQRLDDLAKPGAVLATNTSYLDVDAIASITKRPSEVLGLHFFSPAHIMRLLEVVDAKATAPEVLATGLALGKRIGKLPIVAGVCDGFIGNRIFSIYRRHAEYLLEDGASPRDIDAGVEAYGFAMGPYAVADMSGLDIAWGMRKRRAATRDPAERYVAIPDRFCEAGRLGRKVGKGWYDYVDGKLAPSAEADAIIEEGRRFAGRPVQIFRPEKIQLRLLSMMVNEGAKVLEEGISLRPSDIDLVFVNGYGFPRLKGGPMFAADQLGLAAILEEVREAALSGGAGSEPSDLLVRLAESGSSFSKWQSTQATGRDSAAERSRND